MQSRVDTETITARLERAQNAAAEMAVALETARDLAGCVHPDEVGEVLLRTAREITGAAECALWIRDAHGELRQATSTNGSQSIETIESRRRRLLARALEACEPAMDYGEIDQSQPKRGFKRAALPVLFREECVGILELASLAAPEHGDDQVAALGRVIPMVGLALKNALILEENRRVNERLRRALENLERSNEALQIHNETISTLAEEVGSQNEEIRAQNEELQAQREEILARSQENVRLLRQAIDERNRNEAIVAASADGIMVIDADRKVAIVNSALEKLIGCGAEDLLGKPCEHLLDARDSTGECVCDFACPSQGSDLLIGRTVDTTIATRKGERVWVGIATGVIKDEKTGETRGIVHTLRDMTKYKEAERMKDDFISIASHELLTPLTALKGFAQLAHRIGAKSGDNGTLIRALDVLDQEADRVVAVVTRLVDVSRLQAKKLDLQKIDFDLLGLAESVAARLTATTAKHTLRVSADGPVPVHADRDQIEQVLTNLIGNAIKYAPLGGDIAIKIEHLQSLARVSVSDEGIGIPLEKQARVFDKFYQAHNGHRGYSKGLGLGLHICREIVSLHGGQVWVRSEEGKGSVFHFTLPSRDED